MSLLSLLLTLTKCSPLPHCRGSQAVHLRASQAELTRSYCTKGLKFVGMALVLTTRHDRYNYTRTASALSNKGYIIPVLQCGACDRMGQHVASGIPRMPAYFSKAHTERNKYTRHIQRPGVYSALACDPEEVLRRSGAHVHSVTATPSLQRGRVTGQGSRTKEATFMRDQRLPYFGAAHYDEPQQSRNTSNTGIYAAASTV